MHTMGTQDMRRTLQATACFNHGHILTWLFGMMFNLTSLLAPVRSAGVLAPYVSAAVAEISTVNGLARGFAVALEQQGPALELANLIVRSHCGRVWKRFPEKRHVTSEIRQTVVCCNINSFNPLFQLGTLTLELHTLLPDVQPLILLMFYHMLMLAPSYHGKLLQQCSPIQKKHHAL